MPVVLELPSREQALAFNRRRWVEVLENRELAEFPGKVETNRHGEVLMIPPASGSHSSRQGEIAFLLRQALGGKSLPECPVSTVDGVRAADVGWFSDGRFAQVEGQLVFEIAPEICVEVESPSNTEGQLSEKRRLYFEAGAEEVWICNLEGRMRFFYDATPEVEEERSKRCPGFPGVVD
jgi:Uma2 family endonuclease